MPKKRSQKDQRQQVLFPDADDLRKRSACGEAKAADQFWNNGKTICKPCLRAKWRASYKKCGRGWASKNPEALASQRKRRLERIPGYREKLRGWAATSRQKNRLGTLVDAAKYRSIRCGIDCDVGFLAELAETKPSTCPCCGKCFDYMLGTRPGSRPKWLSPSFDRIDIAKGYVRGNVAIICWRCNALKRDGVLEEFEHIIAYMRSHLDPVDA